MQPRDATELGDGGFKSQFASKGKDSRVKVGNEGCPRVEFEVLVSMGAGSTAHGGFFFEYRDLVALLRELVSRSAARRPSADHDGVQI